MADILNYQGNANLAFGSGSENNVGDIGVYDFNPIADSLQKLAKRRNEVSDLEYKQKIADRDTLFKKLATMEVALDKTLPEQRDKLKSKISDIEKLYLQNPDLLSNPDAYVKMQGALRDFNELDSYAKANYVSTTKEQLDAANTADPDDRDKRLAHIQEQRDKLKSNPYDLYNPFQKEVTMDYAAMAPVIPPTTKVLKAGDNYMDETLSYTDPNTFVDYYRTNVLEGPNRSVANMFDVLQKSYGLKPPEERVRDFNTYNQKIAAANKYLADDKKLKPLEFDKDTGQVDWTKTTKDDFNRAVMIGLRFEEKTTTGYNKDRAAAAKVDADIAAKKAGAFANIMKANTDRIYKGALGAAAGKKADAYWRKMNQSIKGAKTEADADAIIDEMYTRNYVNQPKVIESTKTAAGTTFRFSKIQADNSLPLYTIKGAKGPEELIPIGAEEIYDKYETDADGKKTPAKTAKVIRWKGGHFEPIYMYQNKQITGNEMGKMYDKFKQDKLAKGKAWTGSLEDWMKARVDGKDIDLLIRGANGTTDRRLSLAAQRIISNKNQKKGQDGVFEEPQDDQPVPDTPETPEVDPGASMP